MAPSRPTGAVAQWGAHMAHSPKAAEDANTAAATTTSAAAAHAARASQLRQRLALRPIFGWPEAGPDGLAGGDIGRPERTMSTPESATPSLLGGPALPSAGPRLSAARIHDADGGVGLSGRRSPSSTATPGTPGTGGDASGVVRSTTDSSLRQSYGLRRPPSKIPARERGARAEEGCRRHGKADTPTQCERWRASA